MKDFPFTPKCTDFCILRLQPVPGASTFPRRLECPEHGYVHERRAELTALASDSDKPNDYVTEVASPADLVEIGENVFSTY